MGLFRSGPDLPPVVRSGLRGRALAAAETEDGAWVVGTRDDLQAVGVDGAPSLVVPWEQVQRADWDADTTTLQVEPVVDYGRPVTSYTFVLREPEALLQLVRERVTASVVLQRRTDLERKRGFSVIGRRAPAGRGEITWAYEFDRGVDPDDPHVVAAAEAALRDAQESLGM